MSQVIRDTGLARLEDVYKCIIPPLNMENKLPRADAIIEWARAKAKPHEQLGRWKEAANAYLCGFLNRQTHSQDKTTLPSRPLLLRALTNAIGLRKDQRFEEDDIHDPEVLEIDNSKKLQEGVVDDF
ncbi:hypothetical protein N657DRAFT_680316 [Parathielavia appendiculata]|uniref:Uncharacterized protein n=1 Tax=Parathielavia appendiculata TaxID=2587402 RepID=A0AAN6U0R7_9PEZI|nr:hypothetical protein N657DRAFT_680316 [Parathielavia appendiculata]